MDKTSLYHTLSLSEAISTFKFKAYTIYESFLYIYQLTAYKSERNDKK